MTSEQRQLKEFISRRRKADRIEARSAAKWRRDNPGLAAGLDFMVEQLCNSNDDIRTSAVSAAIKAHTKVQIMLAEMLISRLKNNRFKAHQEVIASLAGMGAVARKSIVIAL